MEALREPFKETEGGKVVRKMKGKDGWYRKLEGKKTLEVVR